MPGLTPTRIVLISLLCLSAVARADAPESGGVDPRYPYTLDFSGQFGFLSSLNGYGASEFALGGGVDFAFPVGERRQVVIAASAVTGSSATGTALAIGGAAGYRIMTFADPWRTRLDFQVAADYSRFVRSGTPTSLSVQSGVGIGGRVGAAVHYFFVPGFGVGVEAGVSAYAIKVHFLLAIGPVITANW